MEDFGFRILKKSPRSQARLGLLKTPHGRVRTPAFVVVATQATVKTLSPKELKEIGVQIVLANTYHLYLRPGPEIVAKLGGLHRFMNWPAPLMTDSGGFQIFSLKEGLEQGIGKIFPEEKASIKNDNIKEQIKKNQSKLVKVTEKGVEFTSYLDGSKHFFMPELSIKIQKQLGADIIFTFDECTSPLAGYDYTKKAMERTHRWTERCIQEFKVKNSKSKVKQVLFGIVQGGEYKDLREESAKFIASYPFFGFGIGGSLGKSKKDMRNILEWTIPHLPERKPRHLLGIGRPEDIREAVKRGIDFFDCVWPTRIARNGTFIISEKETIKITQAKYKKSKAPIMKNCLCYCCQNFTRAYLHYLFRANEILALRLASLHNLTFMINFMAKMRREIKEAKL